MTRKILVQASEEQLKIIDLASQKKFGKKRRRSEFMVECALAEAKALGVSTNDGSYENQA